MNLKAVNEVGDDLKAEKGRGNVAVKLSFQKKLKAKLKCEIISGKNKCDDLLSHSATQRRCDQRGLLWPSPLLVAVCVCLFLRQSPTSQAGLELII